MKKSLARLDLNLLFTLQLLLQELSVSKAAKKLNVTPSTVSKSLGKLRDWFDDPLFVKTPSGLTPTPLVMSMEQELSAWLQMSHQLLEKHSDDTPANMHFDLAFESPLSLIMLNELAQAIYQRYPQAKIKTSSWDYDSLDAIIRGDADIGFTGRESHPRSKELLDLLPYVIDHEVLFSDLPVVYMRKDHPALDENWSLDTFLKYPHINIEWEKRDTWALDDILNEQGLQRNSALTLSSFEQALFMVAQPHHHMLTTAPAYCKHYIHKLHPNLVSLPIPLAEEDKQKLMVPFTIIWHKRNARNSKLVWLKEQIKKLYAQVDR